MEAKALRVWWLTAVLFAAGLAGPVIGSAPVELSYRPAPVDNPLRGLVPFVSASGKDHFPHSMEFRYFSLRDLVSAPGRYDWSAVEETLREVSERGNQLIFRVFCEYPGKGLHVPGFLVEGGLKITEWKDHAGVTNHTPDYSNPDLRELLVDFIGAMGEKFDGDPRIAFVTAGILGKWGEWHNHPREGLWAGKEVQLEVMAQLEESFRRTHVLLRYPVGEPSPLYAANAGRPFGYHDDSFAWATLETGKKKDNWYFETALKAAGADGNWRRFPVGGEIRPELWANSFTSRWHPEAQDFNACVQRTHASWLMDSGLFDKRFPLDEERRQTALFEASHLGYELYVREAKWEKEYLYLTVDNLGVAPFYYNWSVELQVVDGTRMNFNPEWDVRMVLPGKPVVWQSRVPRAPAYRVRVVNPMGGGKPLRFANEEQGEEWLEIQMVKRPLVKEWEMEDLQGLLGAGLEGGRNFASGRRMFAAGRCYLCHRFGREGGTGGPALAGISDQFSPNDLLESIVNPGKTITDHYGSSVFLLKTGGKIVGRKVQEGREVLKIVTDPMFPEDIRSLNPREVASIEAYPDSMMPSGLLNTMSDTEILDLLAFLLSDGDPDHDLFKN